MWIRQNNVAKFEKTLCRIEGSKNPPAQDQVGQMQARWNGHCGILFQAHGTLDRARNSRMIS